MVGIRIIHMLTGVDIIIVLTGTDMAITVEGTGEEDITVMWNGLIVRTDPEVRVLTEL